MASVQAEPHLSTEELLQAVGRLDTPQLEMFTAQVNALRARRVAPVLSAPEAELLMHINKGVPPDIQNRYDVLIARRRAGTLTPTEHDELLSLTKQVEQIDARRLELLAELSQLRKVPLNALIEQLGLKPRPHD